jgi:hypothetical protein
VRIALAFGTLVLLPGFAAVAAGVSSPGGAWLMPAWALGIGVAWNSLLLLATLAWNAPFTSLLPWLPATTALAWILGWALGRADLSSSPPRAMWRCRASLGSRSSSRRRSRRSTSLVSGLRS